VKFKFFKRCFVETWKEMYANDVAAEIILVKEMKLVVLFLFDNISFCFLTIWQNLSWYLIINFLLEYCSLVFSLFLIYCFSSIFFFQILLFFFLYYFCSIYVKLSITPINGLSRLVFVLIIWLFSKYFIS
jgi:hypothetical protein